LETSKSDLSESILSGAVRRGDGDSCLYPYKLTIETNKDFYKTEGTKVSQSNPTFSDIVALLNTLIPQSDTNIGDAPHNAFWRNISRDAFVALTTGDWGVDGKLVVPGSPDKSNLYLALAGLNPFDGTVVGRMPDTDRDLNARLATDAELALVVTWIRNNAPA
jgi:hypothetical protein